MLTSGSNATPVGVAQEQDGKNDFIWTPNATTTALVTHKDFTNGFGVVGLPATNMSAEVVSY
ncbi:MAG: hypothetical protein A2666_05585 [Parcubacteria group bacterium RIFCSPHIGHO2_01_FULL_47_10b]|nr:MAG: hypothetical protein A2666_05585 [Parcubacteria group bacterium RIFCSPHIGHO2_01_FULL_47_10b]